MKVLEGVVRACVRLPGVFVECGVYKGGSALRISEVSGGRELHGFDLFGEGLPAPGAHDAFYKGGEFGDNPLPDARKILPPNVYLYQGLFHMMLPAHAPDAVSFAHIDADLYESTRSCLRHLYHRMVPGGMMLFDDYGGQHEPGVQKAVDEWFKQRPEVVLPLTTLQAVVIKV